MCGRFTIVDGSDLEHVASAIEEKSWRKAPPDWSPKDRLDGKDARPTASVQVLTRNGVVVSIPMIWGFSVSWQRSVVFNARVERADDIDGMWAEAFAKRRCIVPVWAFYEPHRSEAIRSPHTGRTVKRPYAFASPDGTPLLLAGIYDRPLDALPTGGAPSGPPRFSIVTTAPTDVVAAIHNRMPLVLDAAEAAAWLQGAPAPLFADRSALHLVIHPEASESERTDGNPPALSDDIQLSLF